jgi:hypothetical protein
LQPYFQLKNSNTKFKNMKKLKFLNIFVLFVTLGFLASCGGSDDETPAPTIRISSTNPAAVSNVITSSAGSTIEITLVSEAQERIKSINATQRVGASESQVSGFPITAGFTTATSDTRVVTYIVPSDATGDITLRFQVTDQKDKVAAVSITVSLSATINTYTAVLLNNQVDGSTPNAFYDPINNTRFTLAQAKANSANVHIIHALRSAGNGGRKLIAPSSVDAVDIYGADLTNPDRVQTWSVRNATKFKSLTLSAAEFDAINSATALTAAAGSSDTYSADNIGSLDVGSTFGALLANGKFVVGRVTAVTGPSVFTPGGTNGGSVTITFKVQK